MGWPAGDEQGYPKKDHGIRDELHDFITAMFEEFTIHYLHRIIKKGLGSSTFDTATNKGIQFPGLSLEAEEEEFSRLAYQKQFAVDSNREDSQEKPNPFFQYLSDKFKIFYAIISILQMRGIL